MGYYTSNMFWHYKLLDTKPTMENDRQVWYLDECTTTTTWLEDYKHNSGSKIPKNVPLAIDEAISAIMSYQGKDALLGDGKVCVLSAEITDDKGDTVGAVVPYKLLITEGRNSRKCDVIYQIRH